MARKILPVDRKRKSFFFFSHAIIVKAAQRAFRIGQTSEVGVFFFFLLDQNEFISQQDRYQTQPNLVQSGSR